MKVSILIPIYNKEKYIERCINSLLAQDLSPDTYQVILVDDGSTDASAQIAGAYASRHTNILLICQENAGPSAARNRALSAATGEYVYFLDADDYIAENVLGQLYEICVANRLNILEFETREVPGEQSSIINRSITNDIRELAFPVTDGVTYIAKNDFKNEAWRYFINRTFLKQSGVEFIKGTLFEDAIFTGSLFLKADRISRANLDIHRYIIVENSIVTSKSRAHNLKFINGMMNAVEKFNDLILQMDITHPEYDGAVKKLKARQQGFVFALLIRTLKYRLLNWNDLKKILTRMRALEAYPFDPKLGGIGNGSNVYTKLIIPICNKKSFLFMGLGLSRLFSLRLPAAPNQKK